MATGERAGRRVQRVLGDPAEGIRSAPLCFAARGFSVHAATSVDARDHPGRERRCRYVNRPPLAYGRLQQLDADTLSFALKTPWDDGTCRIVVSPFELIEKLAGLVPPPRIHLIRYHGELASNAKDRALIVPAPAPTDGAKEQTTTHAPLSRPQRLTWAALLARVFQLDALVCPRCGGRMKLVAALTNADSIHVRPVGAPRGTGLRRRVRYLGAAAAIAPESCRSPEPGTNSRPVLSSARAPRLRPSCRTTGGAPNDVLCLLGHRGPKVTQRYDHPRPERHRRAIEELTDPNSIRTYLTGVGLPAAAGVRVRRVIPAAAFPRLLLRHRYA